LAGLSGPVVDERADRIRSDRGGCGGPVRDPAPRARGGAFLSLAVGTVPWVCDDPAAHRCRRRER
jgi:hypothetical protein